MTVGGPEVQIAAFDPSLHDRSDFDCGIGRINNFIKLSAKKQQKADFTRVFVATRSGSSKVVGFYALNAHGLELSGLPADIVRHAPHEVIPALYLSMLGVSREMQGQGLGSRLMADAFDRVIDTSRQAGVVVLILDVLQGDDAEANRRRKVFYQALGFQPFESWPNRMFISLAKLRKAQKG